MGINDIWIWFPLQLKRIRYFKPQTMLEASRACPSYFNSANWFLQIDVVLCAPFWKRGQKVNVRWPRSGSRWRTRPDADLARTHFHCCSGSDRRRKYYYSISFELCPKYFWALILKHNSAVGPILDRGEEEVKTMNEEPRKLMHWEDPCSIESDQNLFNLIRRELGGEVERPLFGYLGHGGHEEAVLLLLPHWQDLKPPSLSAEVSFSSFENCFWCRIVLNQTLTLNSSR